MTATCPSIVADRSTAAGRLTSYQPPVLAVEVTGGGS